MSHTNVTVSPFNDPCRQNWTIGGLLEYLGTEDSRLNEVEPELLRRLDEALGSGAGWRGAPGPVARLRSIVASVRKDPSAAERRITELLAIPQKKARVAPIETAGRAA